MRLLGWRGRLPGRCNIFGQHLTSPKRGVTKADSATLRRRDIIYPMPDVDKGNRDTVNAMKVAGAGAFGGFVFWILALYSKTVVFSQLPMPGQIGATAVLGVAA